MKDKGTVFQIQKFCTDDGPGIRTTVFLKGCPLNCQWCHNPESKSKKPIIAINFVKCVNCGRCAQICDCHDIKDGEHVFDSSNCKSCGKCIDVCPVKALSYCGETMTVDTVMKSVMSDAGFYKSSSGGLTISGGELLLQADFASEILKQTQEKGIHTCIETSGASSYETLESVAKYTDLILYDVKETNSENHKKYVGIGNELILENLHKLNENNHKFFMRCVIIPGVNDRQDHFDKLAEIYNTHENAQGIQILPYHELGKGKCGRYGINLDEFDFRVPEDDEVEKWNEYLQSKLTR